MMTPYENQELPILFNRRHVLVVTQRSVEPDLSAAFHFKVYDKMWLNPKVFISTPRAVFQSIFLVF